MAAEANLAKISEVLDLIAIEVVKNGRALTELRKEMIVGFERVDLRFDGFDRRLDGVDRRLERLATRVEYLEGGMKSVSSDLAELKGRPH